LDIRVEVHHDGAEGQGVWRVIGSTHEVDNIDVQDPESGLDLPHRAPNLTRGPVNPGAITVKKMDGDAFFSVVILLFTLGYGLFCILCPRKVTEHVLNNHARARYSTYFYGTVFRTRMTGFLAVAIVILVVVSEMLAA